MRLLKYAEKSQVTPSVREVNGVECVQTTGVKGEGGERGRGCDILDSHQTTEASAVFTWVTLDKTRGKGPGTNPNQFNLRWRERVQHKKIPEGVYKELH